jgi:hypothetical protein
LIYQNADSDRLGNLNREQIKDAIITNMDKISISTEASVTQAEPIIAQVMQILDESKSGSIS